MATVYRVRIIRAHGPAAYTVWEDVRSGIFTDHGEADEFARENVEGNPGFRAEVCDEEGIIYSVPSDHWLEDSRLAAHASHHDLGRPVYEID